jgi:hypothetical protein
MEPGSGTVRHEWRGARIHGNLTLDTEEWTEKTRGVTHAVLATAKKTTLIESFRTHDTDTGSPEVQIAILSARIAN